MQIASAILNEEKPSSNKTLSSAAILYQHSFNYYHWFEHLLKLRGIIEYETRTGEDVKLIIPSNPPRFILESLDLMGFGENKRVQWDGGKMQVNSLIVPSFPEPTPSSIMWVRQRMADQISTKGGSSKWIYISRQNVKNRQVKNFEEISGVLQEYGVEIIACEDLTIEDQVSLFKSVKGIIGVHGAGLTNMVWADEVPVLILFNRNINPLFNHLAEASGHDVKLFLGEAVGEADREINRDLIIDPEKFEQEIAKIVQ